MSLSQSFRKPSSWTRADFMLMRIAGVFLVMGVMSHVLPAMGLQFRRLAHLGNAAPVAGTVMIALGSFFVLYVTLLKGKMKWVIAGASGIAVLGLCAVLIVGYFDSQRMHNRAEALRHAAVTQSTTPTMPEQARSLPLHP